MSTQFCPECHQPMKNLIHGVRFPDFKAALFRYIETHPGQSGRDLAGFFEKGTTSIRSHIYQINEILMDTDIRIVGSKFTGYHVKKIKSCLNPVF